MLTLDGVGRAFGEGPLLFAPVTARCAAATCVAVRGPHGSGKSVLLRLISGLDRATTGTIHMDGVPGGSPRSRGVTSLILPEHGLLATRTAVENLVLSQRLAGHPRGFAVEAAYQMLRRVDLLAVADRFPNELSRSQHRLACIARAVLRRPRLMVADEPGEGLRPAAAAAAKALLSEAVVQGALLVMAATAVDPAAPEPAAVIALQPATDARAPTC